MARCPPNPLVILKWCKYHSLSLTCLVLGTTCILVGVFFTAGEGWVWDLWSGGGVGFLTVGVWGLLAGPLMERNKPDEPPD